MIFYHLLLNNLDVNLVFIYLMLIIFQELSILRGPKGHFSIYFPPKATLFFRN